MTRDESSMLDDCARVCHECQDACLKGLVHALDLGGQPASRPFQTLLHDCAAICAVSHGYLHRHSPRHAHTCTARSRVCRECAEECRRVGGGDPVLNMCATVCDRCSRSCERMSSAAA